MSQGAIKLGYALLGLMSVVSFGGPFLIGAVLKGGEASGWPPDRPIEWVVVGGLTLVVVGVLIGLTFLWLANLKHLQVTKERMRLVREAKEQAAAEAERGAP